MIEDASYTWDPSGNPTRRERIRTSGTIALQWQADSANRIRSAELSDSSHVLSSTSYDLNERGRRLFVGGGPDGGAYLMDGSAQLGDAQMQQYTQTPFDQRTYDPVGNTLSRNAAGQPLEQLRYDVHNRLVQRSQAGATTRGYRFDALGRFLGRTLDPGGANALDVIHVYDGNRIVETYNGGGSNQPVAEYAATGAGDLIVRDSAVHGRHFFHVDDMGSTVALSDGVGEVAEAYTYDDSGRVLDEQTWEPRSVPSQLGNSFLYAGRRWTTGLDAYLVGNSFLDPRAGRGLDVRGWGRLGDAGGSALRSATSVNSVWEAAPDPDHPFASSFNGGTLCLRVPDMALMATTAGAANTQFAMAPSRGRIDATSRLVAEAWQETVGTAFPFEACTIDRPCEPGDPPWWEGGGSGGGSSEPDPDPGTSDPNGPEPDPPTSDPNGPEPDPPVSDPSDDDDDDPSEPSEPSGPDEPSEPGPCDGGT